MKRSFSLSSSLSVVVFGLVAACGSPPVREDQMESVDETEDAVRACANGPTVQGIDVSHYQGSINWGAVATEKAFAIIKATEGTGYIDPQFGANWGGAQAAGVLRGAYHYFHPSSDPIAQADLFVNVMGALEPGDLPPMLDLEDTDGLSQARVADATRRFLEHVEARTGRRPMIYTGFYFWRDQVGDPGGFNQYPLVMAAYVSGCPLVPDSWGTFTMWQYTSSGRVAGISGNVDLDVFNGDIDALRDLAQSTPSGPPPPAPVGCGILGYDLDLKPGDALTSCSGRFTFVHQGDGNAVLYDNALGDAMWATGTNGQATETLVMQGDGNLVLYAPGARPIWASGTYRHPGSYLVMQDDGNLVLYAPGARALWYTDTVRGPVPVPGCGLSHAVTAFGPGQGAGSCDGRFFFVHQEDGNVVLYAPGGRPLWATGTNGRATDALVMQDDGNLVLYASGGRAIWSSHTYGNPGAFLAVQDDGNVVIYTAGGRAIWATHTFE